MFLVAWAVICVLTVPLAGGRLAHLSDFKIRSTLLLFGGLALQVVITVVVPDGPDWLHPSAHVLSYLLVIAFLVRNFALPAMWIVALGGLLNFVVIVANGGVMPATSRALSAVGAKSNSGRFVNSGAISDPNLAFLGDAFALPRGMPLNNVFSVGDILVALGVLLMVHSVCQSRLGKWVPAMPTWRAATQHSTRLQRSAVKDAGQAGGLE